jgi:simple sugar transport system substrate-binding protein
LDTDATETSAGLDRASLLKRVGLGGAALSLPALLKTRDALGAAGADGGGNFPAHPNWKFAFVNHLKDSPFFVPTRYGAADACSLLGCSYTWSGSGKAVVGEMLRAFEAAVSAKVDGIAVAVVHATAFEAPIRAALAKGIPVVSYNADGASAGSHARMAYIGQALYDSGFAMGRRIATLVPKGDVAIFVATPDGLNVRPRLDGVLAAIKQSGKPINVKVVPTGPLSDREPAVIDAYYVRHKSLNGMFALDGTDTQAVGQTIRKHGLAGKVNGAGYDLLPGTLELIDQGFLDFTIDQQPYLQGFYPVLHLFLYKLSGGLQLPSDTNTSLLFVSKANVTPYLTTKTRYEGSSSAQRYPIS